MPACCSHEIDTEYIKLPFIFVGLFIIFFSNNYSLYQTKYKQAVS